MILFRLRFWLLVAAAALLLVHGPTLWHTMLTGMKRTPPLEEMLQDRVRQAVGHVLETDRWTMFPLTLNGEVVRVLTNGEVLASLPTPEGVEWPYALEYRLVDGRGSAVIEGTYHHDTRATLFQLPGEAVWRTPAFFRIGQRPLSDTRIFPLNVAGFEAPLTLHLRLKGRDPALGVILARVSMEEFTDPDRQTTLWQRLSPDAREKIAAFTLYPADLLSEEEKINLMRDLWRPQGPRGLPDRDYQSLPFLVWEEGMENLLEPFVPTQGLPFGGPALGVIPLPEEVGRIRLTLARATPVQNGLAEPMAISVRWFGRLAHERRSWSLTWRGEDLRLTPPRGGLLVAGAPESMVLRAFHVTDREGGTEVEITPAPLLSAHWSGGEQNPLHFPVRGEGYDESVPFRVSLRLLAPPDAPLWLGNATVAWRFLDSKGENLATGQWSWSPRPSPFDRPSGNQHEGSVVSMPENLVLSAPMGSHTLVVDARPPIFVTVANRPPDLVHLQRIPEDAFAPAMGDDPRQPAWFPLRPEGWRSYHSEGRLLLVAASPAPPEETDPPPSTGWESLEPSNNIPGRFLLTTRGEGANALPVTGRGSGYRLIPPGQPVEVELAAEPGVARLSPTLVYGKRDKTATPLTLHVDGVATLRTQLPGPNGEITLPPMTPGRHRLWLDGPAETLLLLSHGAEPTHVKRFAQRVQAGESLHYRVEKRDGGSLILSGRLHTPTPNTEDQRSRLLARVDLPPRPAGGQTPDWTIPRRRFDIRPAMGDPNLVLESGGASVDDGQPFFIPLGEDLAPGVYGVTLTLEEGSARYLTLGATTPGPAEERRLFLEEAIP